MPYEILDHNRDCDLNDATHSNNHSALKYLVPAERTTTGWYEPSHKTYLNFMQSEQKQIPVKVFLSYRVPPVVM